MSVDGVGVAGIKLATVAKLSLVCTVVDWFSSLNFRVSLIDGSPQLVPLRLRSFSTDVAFVTNSSAAATGEAFIF